MFKKEYIETGINKLQFEDGNQFFAIHFSCFLKTERAVQLTGNFIIRFI